MLLNERCYICNKVSSELIETNAGEALGRNFFRDSQVLTRTICEPCKEAHEELMLEYSYNDNVWNNDHDNDNSKDNIVFGILSSPEEITVSDQGEGVDWNDQWVSDDEDVPD